MNKDLAEARRIRYMAEHHPESELKVSSCCSASMWGEQDWPKCNRCGEHCDAVELE